MAESQLKPRSFADRVVPAHWPKAEPEVEEARESFQEGRARSRESVMLDIRLADGSVESFPYAYLTRVRYIPGDSRQVTDFGNGVLLSFHHPLARLFPRPASDLFEFGV